MDIVKLIGIYTFYKTLPEMLMYCNYFWNSETVYVHTYIWVLKIMANHIHQTKVIHHPESI